MRTMWTLRLCFFVLLVTALSTPAWAYKRDVRLPLTGSQGNFAASGSIRYVIKRNEPGVAFTESLRIELRSVPLTPGTVLAVYVGNELVGELTIDSRQSGSLTVSNENRRYIPSLNWGTSVMVKKLDGSVVMW